VNTNVPTRDPDEPGDELVTDEMAAQLAMNFIGPNGEHCTITPPTGRPLSAVLKHRRMLAIRMVDDLGWRRVDDKG